MNDCSHLIHTCWSTRRAWPGPVYRPTCEVTCCCMQVVSMSSTQTAVCAHARRRSLTPGPANCDSAGRRVRYCRRHGCWAMGTAPERAPCAAVAAPPARYRGCHFFGVDAQGLPFDRDDNSIVHRISVQFCAELYGGAAQLLLHRVVRAAADQPVCHRRQVCFRSTCWTARWNAGKACDAVAAAMMYHRELFWRDAPHGAGMRISTSSGSSRAYARRRGSGCCIR